MDANFPRAVRILDFFHAAEHLAELAKSCSGGDSAAAEDLTDRWDHQQRTSQWDAF